MLLLLLLTKASGSTDSFPFFNHAIKPFPLRVIMSLMVRLKISSSFGGKEQLSQIKMMTFSTVKTNGLLLVLP